MNRAEGEQQPANGVVLVAHELVRSFATLRALQGLSLELRAGEIYGLVGPDGAGKTTLMRILAGMIAPDEGTAQVLGLNPLSSTSRLRSALGYMPQQYSLYGDLTVEENLYFFARMFCLPRADYRQRRERLLSITRLSPFTGRRADALSGGMYKKLALACALLPRPKLLLLDEPTNGVDPVSRRELWTLLFELAIQGMAILVSTPYMDEAARCHRVGLIHRGKLLLEGAPADLLAQYAPTVVSLTGGDRDRCDQLLAHHQGVVSSSLVGASFRVIVRKGAEEDLRQALAESGATVQLVRANVEDLFLAATAEA